MEEQQPQVTREQIINLLNEDIALEYSAALQYIQHYAVVAGAQFDAIRAHLLEHAEQEIDHAVKLSDRVNYMGGTPVAHPGPVKLSPNPVEMLQQDLSGEQTAIQRYKERIAQAAALGEFGLVAVLQGILVDEEEHENDLETSLGGLVEAPVAPPVPAGGPIEAGEYKPVIMARFAALRHARDQRQP